MEEIIGLLVVLAVGIFKAVNKKLEDSGKKPVKPFVSAQEQTLPETQVFVPQRRTAEPEPVAPKPVMSVPAASKVQPSTIEVVTRQTAARKPILEEPEEQGPKEKIAPKKLVIYSEIMKPKFNE